MPPDTKRIHDTLARLASLPWPNQWGSAEAAAMRNDFNGWSHRYRLNPVATEAEVAAFERAQRVSLPSEYRRFLLEVGNGGAGPHYGIYPLGTCAGEPLPASMLRALSKPFEAGDAEAWEPGQKREVMKGAMIIGTAGCATWFWLIITGPNRGEVWRDARGDYDEPGAVVDADGEPVTFRGWYDRWLDECIAKWPL